MLNQNANHPRLIPTDSIQPFGAQMLTCCEPLCHGHACTLTYLFSRNKQGQNKQAPGNPKLHQRDSVAMLNKRKVSSWCVCGGVFVLKVFLRLRRRCSTAWTQRASVSINISAPEINISLLNEM